MKFSPNNPCPCGSAKKYKRCCQVFHKGKIAKNTLELMKSRYSAFVVGEIDYIIKTSTFQKDYEDLMQFSKSCEFKKLEVLEYSQNSVTFKANIICNGVDNSFTEKSYFIFKDNRWYYDSGEILEEG